MRFEEFDKNSIIVHEKCFDPCLSALCGQAFRWKMENGTLHGVAAGHVLDISRFDDVWLFTGTDGKLFEHFWADYFDLNRDYSAICANFASDETLSRAVTEFSGIRILHQEPWEALCSFIISQNNNIPRISGIVSRLCENFGEEIAPGEWSFPEYEALAELDAEALAPLRAGFRARYIIDAACKLKNEVISLTEIAALPIEQARLELMKITGVGAKVAECTLLYGFGRLEAFPVDVWVKRIMALLYPDGLPECTRGVQGIAQQYLFHWYRSTATAVKTG